MVSNYFFPYAFRKSCLISVKDFFLFLGNITKNMLIANLRRAGIQSEGMVLNYFD